MDIEINSGYLVVMFFITFITTIAAYFQSPPPFKKLVLLPFISKAGSALVVVIYYVGLESLREYGPVILRFALLLSELSHILFVGVVYWYFMGVNPVEKIGTFLTPYKQRIKTLISRIWNRRSP